MIGYSTYSRCRRDAGIFVATLFAATILGCSEPTPARTATPPTVAPRVAQPSAPERSPDRALDGWEVDYFSGYFDEVLRGDVSSSKRAFESVVASYDVRRELAARSALRLATYAAAARRRRIALDLVARARHLGGDEPEISGRAQRMQERLASVSAEDIEVRGPSAGTVLKGVSEVAVQRFAAAEKLLAGYHRRKTTSRLEDVMSSVRGKRAAADNAVRAYREVIALREPAATVASEFRIASLYYDLSLSLRYDLASEMEREFARTFRGQLSSWALSNRRKARSAYRRSLASAGAADSVAVASRWREASLLGLSSVEDLLRPR